MSRLKGKKISSYTNNIEYFIINCYDESLYEVEYDS